MKDKLRFLTSLLAVLVALPVFFSCETTTDGEEEFINWKEKNETFFEALYAQASREISAGNQNWKILTNYSLQPSPALESDDHVIVKVLEAGTGSGMPLFSDTVRIHFRAWLLRSENYVSAEDPDLGYVFDQTYSGVFNPETAAPVKQSVSFTPVQTASGTVSDVPIIDGMTTALMNMHIGDHWKLYVPYKLGYGTTKEGAIPAYSTLVFEIRLHSYYHAGEAVPDFKSPSFN